MIHLTFSLAQRFLLLLNVGFALTVRGRHRAIDVEGLKLSGSSRGDEAQIRNRKLQIGNMFEPRHLGCYISEMRADSLRDGVDEGLRGFHVPQIFQPERVASSAANG